MVGLAVEASGIGLLGVSSYTGIHYISIDELLSKNLVSLLISPILLPYIIP